MVGKSWLLDQEAGGHVACVNKKQRAAGLAFSLLSLVP